MQVLNLWSDARKETPVDIFVDEPFPFNERYDRAQICTFDKGVCFRIVDLDTLLQMKRKAGRPKDLEDIRQLERMRDARK